LVFLEWRFEHRTVFEDDDGNANIVRTECLRVGSDVDLIDHEAMSLRQMFEDGSRIFAQVTAWLRVQSKAQGTRAASA
jgi:hypothetical protein